MINPTAPLWLRFVAPSVLFLALGVPALPVLEMGVEGAKVVSKMLEKSATIDTVITYGEPA